MNGDELLAHAVSEWRRKYNIADGDPAIAMLDLVRIYLRHSREIDDEPDSPPPPFDTFRDTIYLLDRRSKSFVQQAACIMGELRRFGESVKRINHSSIVTYAALLAFGILTGCLLESYL
jgi:hypothetical protein